MLYNLARYVLPFMTRFRRYETPGILKLSAHFDFKAYLLVTRFNMAERHCVSPGLKSSGMNVNLNYYCSMSTSHLECTAYRSIPALCQSSSFPCPLSWLHDESSKARRGHTDRIQASCKLFQMLGRFRRGPQCGKQVFCRKRFELASGFVHGNLPMRKTLADLR